MTYNVIIGIAVGFFFSSCGKNKEIDGNKPVDSTTPADKSKSTTTQDGTIKLVDNLPYPCDAKVIGNIVYLKGSGFQVCSEQGGWQPLDLRGETGAQGPQGFAGPKGGSALVAVYDAQDRKLGWLMNSVLYGGQYHIHVILTAGVSVFLQPNGLFSFVSATPSDRTAYYELGGCTGNVRASEPLVLIGGDAPQISSKTNLGSFTYFSARSSGSGCISYPSGGSLVSSYSASSIILPSGASYPFEGPISLRAE